MTPTLRGVGRDGGYGMGEGGPCVLMAFHDPLLNGATLSALRAVPYLEERGWRFSFWVPAPGPCFEWLAGREADVRGTFRPVVSGFQALREPPGIVRRLAATPGYLASFSRALRDANPRLVHANSLYSYAEALTARAARRPTLLHLHDMAPRGKLRSARAIARSGVHHSIGVSRACAASYAHNGWSPGLVYEAAPVPDEAAPVRESPSPFVVGTVGVVARRKGSDLFVAAAKQLLARFPGRFEFRMVGSPTDPLEREWGDAVVREAKSAGVVHVPEADVYAELRGWDAFALASRMDPCPIVKLEAMASGLPVVGARTDGIAEQVTPESGILVPPDDSRALAAGIERIADADVRTRAAMGVAGRRRVETVFSLESQAEGLDAAYRLVLGD